MNHAQRLGAPKFPISFRTKSGVLLSIPDLVAERLRVVNTRHTEDADTATKNNEREHLAPSSAATKRRKLNPWEDVAAAKRREVAGTLRSVAVPHCELTIYKVRLGARSLILHIAQFSRRMLFSLSSFRVDHG